MAAANAHHDDLDLETDKLTENEKQTLAVMKKELGADVVEKALFSMVIRFIRGYAREKDPVGETVSRMRETLKFRAEKNVDGLVDHPPARLAEFRSLWKSNIYGRGRLGHPILVEQVGDIDPHELLKHFNMDECTHFHIYAMEVLTRTKENIARYHKRSLYKHIAILDLNNLTMKHFGEEFRGPLKAFAHIDQHYYPESLYKLVIVNAPWIFRMIWAVVAPWLHPLTRERIKMGADHLKEIIDEDQIPDFLGGRYNTKGVDRSIVADNFPVRYHSFLMGTRPGPGKDSSIRRFVQDPLFKRDLLVSIGQWMV